MSLFAEKDAVTWCSFAVLSQLRKRNYRLYVLSLLPFFCLVEGCCGCNVFFLLTLHQI